MKKILGIIVVFTLGLFMVACDSTTESGVKVGLISSAATFKDKGYNEFALDGLNQAKADFDITANHVEGRDSSAIAETLDRFGREKYALVFSLEYDFDVLIKSYKGGKSIAERYPDTTFVVFNATPNTDNEGNKIHDNVIEVLFNVNEGSFLAGALYTLVNENRDALFTDTKYKFADARVAAFMGATESEGISVFAYGFYQGINYVAAQKDVVYDIYETYQAGFAASTENANRAKAFYENDANVIFGVAGPVAGNIRNEAETAGRLMIDVDANQDAQKPGFILTSVLKNTNTVVYDMIKELIEDKLETGTVRYFSLVTESTGITDLEEIVKHINQSQLTLWNTIKAEIETIKGKIVSGDIVVIDAQKGDTLNKSSLTNLNFK